MEKVNTAEKSKSPKKELKHKIEAALEQLMKEMVSGKEISKHLHKKIKKAGKLLAEGLTEEKQSEQKEPVKAAPKQPMPKAKKAAAKKAVVKKAPGKKAAKKEFGHQPCIIPAGFLLYYPWQISHLQTLINRFDRMCGCKPVFPCLNIFKLAVRRTFCSFLSYISYQTTLLWFHQ